MDLHRLTYFVAVAEEHHLGRAAGRLHLSQPPLTRQIKALEAEVGAQLFERTPRGMVLTHAGDTLLRDARFMFGMVEQAADRAHRAGRGKLGRLDVGVYGSAIFGIVPNILARFRARTPMWRLRCTTHRRRSGGLRCANRPQKTKGAPKSAFS